MSMELGVTFSKVACIGTGFSGIGLGASLQRWYGETDVVFFERSESPCGTWNTNKYPGCACDVPSALYSFSYEQSPDWTRVLPSNTEIEKYLNRVVDKYDLRQRMYFGVEVKEAEWIESRKRWRLTLLNKAEDRHYLHECQVLFSATGVLVYPRELGVPGVENFKGEICHSARWKKDLDLTNKKVVLFGNGCTAAQIVPAIVDKVQSLTQIIRSKHWIFPQMDGEYPGWMSWAFRNIPLALRFHRWQIYAGAESDFKLFPNTPAASKLRAQRRVEIERHMRTTAPAKWHDLLIPDFDVGCKRRIYDPGYLKSLHSDKITLTDKKAVEIVENGVRTADGIIEAEVILLANGFKTNEFIAPLVLRGRGGKALAEHWDEIGAPEAYQGSAISGFPNFFLLLGPNTVTGHTSAIMASENSVNYALRILKPFFQGKASMVEIKIEAELKHMVDIQDALSRTVWSTGCNSWYVSANKKTGKQWNALAYPYSQAFFWWRSFFPIWRDWTITSKISRNSSVPHRLTKYALLSLALAISLLVATKPLGRQQNLEKAKLCLSSSVLLAKDWIYGEAT